MNKYILVLIFLLLFSFSASANSLNKFEFNTGVSYNNLLYNSYQDGQKNKDNLVAENLHEGIGFYGEGIFLLTNKLEVGFGIDKVIANYKETNQYEGSKIRDSRYTRELDGYYGKIRYHLDHTISLSNSFIYYFYKESFDAQYSWEKDDFNQIMEKGQGLGWMIGAEVDSPINENLSLKLFTGYRIANIKLVKEYDWYEESLIDSNDDKLLKINGLSISAGLSYEF